MTHSGITIDSGIPVKVFGEKVKLDSEDGGGFGIKTKDGKIYEVFYYTLKVED